MTSSSNQDRLPVTSPTERLERKGPSPVPRKPPPLPPEVEDLPPYPREGDILAGKYQLERLIGRGGMGWVYEAQQAPLNRRVALKLLAPAHQRPRPVRRGEDPIRRFLFEAAATARLGHPHIVTVHDAGTTAEGLPFLAMEWLEGLTLHRVLQEHGPIGLGRACRIGSQIAQALHHVHQQGWVHCDVKPGNIMLIDGPGGQPEVAKLIDFGLVQTQDRESEGPCAVTGTFGYMSPEQTRDQRVTAASDIYALGCVLYRMLAGRLPFVAADPVALLEMHRTASPPRLSSLAPEANHPPHLQDLLHTCLQKAPEHRPGSMLEIIEQLEVANVLDEESGVRFLELEDADVVATTEVDLDLLEARSVAGGQMRPA